MDLESWHDLAVLERPLLGELLWSVAVSEETALGDVAAEQLEHFRWGKKRPYSGKPPHDAQPPVLAEEEQVHREPGQSPHGKKDLRPPGIGCLKPQSACLAHDELPSLKKSRKWASACRGGRVVFACRIEAVL